MYDRFDNWQQWKYYYREQLKHPAGFEEMFVDKVLSQVTGLTPSDVIPQYHFVDDAGGNRYIDFMVLNEAKGYHLAIELDGLTKIQNGYNTLDYVRYQDMWVRQNALMRTGAVLLRFTNKDMFERVNWVIQSVIDTLVSQHQQFTNKQQVIQNYQAQIQTLQNQSQVSQQTWDTVAMLKTQMAQIQQQLQAQATIFSEPEPQTWVMKAIPSVGEIQAEYAREEQAKLANSTNRLRAFPWFWLVLIVVIVIGGFYALKPKTITAEQYVPPAPSKTEESTSYYSDNLYSNDASQYTPVDVEEVQKPHTQETASEYKVNENQIKQQVAVSASVQGEGNIEVVEPVSLPKPTPKPSYSPPAMQETKVGTPSLADKDLSPNHNTVSREDKVERVDREVYSERGTRTQMPDEARADRDEGY